MKNNFKNILTTVLKIEGGYSDNRFDKGGATNRGITRKTLAAWRGIKPWRKLPKSAVKNLTLAEATKIYQAKYWLPIKGNELPAGLDLSVFDAAVNSGPSRAIKWLQAVVGAKRDGWLGPETLAAIERIIDMPGAINKFNDKRLSFVHALRSWKYFGNGWSRRIATVRAKSIAMWMRVEGIEKASQQHVLQTGADKAGQIAKRHNQTAAGTGITGMALTAWSLLTNGDWLSWGLLVATVLVMVILINRAASNETQAAALKSETKKVK